MEECTHKRKTKHKEKYTQERAGENECGGRRVHTVECIHGGESTRGEHTWRSTYGGEHTQRIVHTGRAQMGRAYAKESTHGGVLSTQRRKCTHPGVHMEESAHEEGYTREEHTEEYTRGKHTWRSIHGGVHTGVANTGRAHTGMEEYTRRNTHGGERIQGEHIVYSSMGTVPLMRLQTENIGNRFFFRTAPGKKFLSTEHSVMG